MESPPTTPIPPSRRGPRTGQEIAGKYRLGALLGKGGRGEVYAALQIDLNRDVAVKLLADSCRQDDDAGARFLRETRIAADIRHSGVVQVYDAGIDADDLPYCVMELLEGETLAERLERTGPLGPEEAVAVTAGLCSALQAVHDKGFLHRDVKPSNVFLARRKDGGVDAKLIDFGIAKRVALDPMAKRRLTTMRGLGSPKETAMDIIVGSPRYLSPEQILGTKLDARSDVHAMAATLYEMLAGTPAFESDKLADLLAKIVTEPAEPISVRAPLCEVPEPLDRAILRALAKDPAARPASAADFATLLWAALADAKHGTTISTPPGPASGRRSLGLALVAGIVVAVVASAAIVVARRPPREAAHAAGAVLAAAPAPPAPQPAPSPPASAAAPPPAPLTAASTMDHIPHRPPASPRRESDDLKSPY